MLYAKLLEYRKNKRLVGYCRWKDGEGLLFGRVVEVSRTQALFALVNPDGTFDEEKTEQLRDITRLTASPAYVKRLLLFAKLDVPKSKAEKTRTRATIAKRLRVAARTGECVDLTLKGDPRHEYRVVRVARDLVELEEYGDDPREVLDTKIVRIDQIATLTWRGTVENAVTRVWRSKA